MNHAPATITEKPAAPLATTITPGAATATVITQPDRVPGYLLEDADMRYASTLGIGKDLGLVAPTATTTEKEPPLADGSQKPAEGAAAPVVAAVAETPEQELARLKMENAALKAGKNLPVGELADGKGKEPAPVAGLAPAPPANGVPKILPTTDNPLANLREDNHFALAENASRRLKEWAIENRAGGVLPTDLAQLVENAEAQRAGREPQTITAGGEIDAATSANIQNLADRMLTQHLPARQRYVATEKATLGLVQKDDPEIFDGKSEKNTVWNNLLRTFPQILNVPEWPLLAQDLVTGYLANRKKGAKPAEVQAPAPAKAAVAAVTDESGKVVPFAGAAPVGGNAPAAPSYTQRQIDEAEKRLRAGKHTDDDLMILGAAAV